MAVTLGIPTILEQISHSQALQAAVCVSILVLYFAILRARQANTKIPWFTLDGHDVFNPSKERTNWVQRGRLVLTQGLKKFQAPFRVLTPEGAKIVLPNSYANEIRNNPDLIFSDFLKHAFMGDIPGFEAVNVICEQNIIQDVIRTRLTRSLDAITQELSTEATRSCYAIFGNSKEWQTLHLKANVYKFVARLSARIFLGEEITHNEEYLDINVHYTEDFFIGMRELRNWSPFMRQIVHWFLPECRKVRHNRAEVRRIVAPIVEKQLEKHRQQQEVKSTSKTAQMVGWVNDLAKSRNSNINIADAQLLLSMAAIETTTSGIVVLMMDLLSCPGLIERLREEIVPILRDGGWKKSSLHEMKLLDSVLKESGRVHRLDFATMERMAIKNLTLSDGTSIPRGAYVCVASVHNFEDIYPDAKTFKPDRFLIKRETESTSKWQFISTSPESLTFGHGRHACPGRMFASNEMKIAFVHLLLKYEWSLDGVDREEIMYSGVNPFFSPRQMIRVKRRESEIDID